MNLAEEVLRKAESFIQAAAYSTFTSEFASVDADKYYPWEVIIRHTDDGEHPDNEISLCSVNPRSVNRRLFERCKFSVERGLGFSSDADLEAYQNGTHKDKYHCLDHGASIPPKPEIGKAFCITLLWRLEPVYFVFVTLNSGDEALIERDLKGFVTKLDRQLQALEAGWLIGGALPDGYERLGEADEP